MRSRTHPSRSSSTTPHGFNKAVTRPGSSQPGRCHPTQNLTPSPRPRCGWCRPRQSGQPNTSSRRCPKRRRAPSRHWLPLERHLSMMLGLLFICRWRFVRCCSVNLLESLGKIYLQCSSKRSDPELGSTEIHIRALQYPPVGRP